MQIGSPSICFRFCGLLKSVVPGLVLQHVCPYIVHCLTWLTKLLSHFYLFRISSKLSVLHIAKYMCSFKYCYFINVKFVVFMKLLEGGVYILCGI